MRYSKQWEIKGFKAAPPHQRILKVLLSPDLQGTKNVAVGMTLLPPGSKSSSHVHDKEEELWVVLNGRGYATVGKEKISIEKDVAIYIPPKEEHQLINVSDETLKVLWIFSPPGPERNFIGKEGGKA